MSSIDAIKKIVVLRDGGFITSEKWIADLRAEGYEIKDFRRPLTRRKRRASDELS